MILNIYYYTGKKTRKISKHKKPEKYLNIKNPKKSFRGPSYPRSDFGVDILRDCPVFPPIFLFLCKRLGRIIHVLSSTWIFVGNARFPSKIFLCLS